MLKEFFEEWGTAFNSRGPAQKTKVKRHGELVKATKQQFTFRDTSIEYVVIEQQEGENPAVVVDHFCVVPSTGKTIETCADRPQLATRILCGIRKGRDHEQKQAQRQKIAERQKIRHERITELLDCGYSTREAGALASWLQYQSNRSKDFAGRMLAILCEQSHLICGEKRNNDYGKQLLTLGVYLQRYAVRDIITRKAFEHIVIEHPYEELKHATACYKEINHQLDGNMLEFTHFVTVMVRIYSMILEIDPTTIEAPKINLSYTHKKQHRPQRPLGGFGDAFAGIDIGKDGTLVIKEQK